MNAETCKEIREAKKLIENPHEHPTKIQYSPVNIFTTENIKGITENVHFEGKDILLPCSHGDHIFNAILFNANSIEAYDINALSKHMFELKKAAILALTKEEFLEFFFITNISIASKAFNKTTYHKIREFLPKESKIYWDYIYAKYTEKQIRKSNLFSKTSYSKKDIVAINPYLEDFNYEQLKQKLRAFNLRFYHADIADLSTRQDTKYDYIYLSNIAEYLCSNNVLATLQSIVVNLEKSLNPNGKIGVIYLYSYRDEYFFDSKSPIYNQFIRDEYFNEDEYSYVEFASPSVQKPGQTMKKVRAQDKDSILTYQNKNN